MSEWVKYKIQDIATVVGGGTPSTKINEYWDGDIPWLTPRDLTGYNKMFISKGERSITDLGLAKSSAKLIPKNSILLTSRAPIGYVAIASNEICTNQGFKSLVPKSNTESKFLFYWIKDNVDYLNQLGTGTTFAEISGGVVKDIEINLPPLPEQKAIAEVLSSLDDKIDLLHRQNQTLEKMAETLFRQWFDSLDYNSTIGDLINVQNGYAFKSKDFTDTGKHHVIKIKNINDNRVNIVDSDYVSEDVASSINSKFRINSGDILFAMTGAEIGKMGIVENNNEDLWLNQRVGLFKEKFIGSKYLAYLCLQSDFGQDYIENTSTGSAQPNINAVGIENCPFPTLTEEEIVNKSIMLSELYKKVNHNLSHIKSIEKLRDTLLPKLMSGEIRIDS